MLGARGELRNALQQHLVVAMIIIRIGWRGLSVCQKRLRRGSVFSRRSPKEAHLASFDSLYQP
eukprot:1159320-Pelagomonas_calceolata.AAC.19